MQFLNKIREFKNSFSEYRPAIEVLVFKDYVLHNLSQYTKNYPDYSFAPVLKSNAYGHGLIQMAEILDDQKIPFFAVDSLYEAMLLKDNGIKSKIVILGYCNVENINASKIDNTSYMITSLDQLKELNRVLNNKKPFHLKIDTGMHRQGLMPEQIPEAVQLIGTNKYIDLEGVCSHLADADGAEAAFTQSQIEKWKKACALLKSNFSNIKYFHLANTAGTFYANDEFCNVARLGLGLYGINPSPFTQLDLKPALEVQSVVSSVRDVPAGDFVGYNISFKATTSMKVATVPMGYYEGVPRRLSNCGSFRISGVDCPILGRVSMNITSIDVSALPGVKFEDKVIVVSRHKADANSVENMAKTIGAVPYEILVRIPQHLRRVVTVSDAAG